MTLAGHYHSVPRCQTPPLVQKGGRTRDDPIFSKIKLLPKKVNKGLGVDLKDMSVPSCNWDSLPTTHEMYYLIHQVFSQSIAVIVVMTVKKRGNWASILGITRHHAASNKNNDTLANVSTGNVFKA